MLKLQRDELGRVTTTGQSPAKQPTYRVTVPPGYVVEVQRLSASAASPVLLPWENLASAALPVLGKYRVRIRRPGSGGVASFSTSLVVGAAKTLRSDSGAWQIVLKADGTATASPIPNARINWPTRVVNGAPGHVLQWKDQRGKWADVPSGVWTPSGSPQAFRVRSSGRAVVDAFPPAGFAPAGGRKVVSSGRRFKLFLWPNGQLTLNRARLTRLAKAPVPGLRPSGRTARLAPPARVGFKPDSTRVISTRWSKEGATVFADIDARNECISVKVKTPIWQQLQANADTGGSVLAPLLAPKIQHPNYLPLTKQAADIAIKGGTLDDIQKLLAANGVASPADVKLIIQDVYSLLGCSNAQARAVMDSLAWVVSNDATNAARNDGLQRLLNMMMNLRAKLDARTDPRYTATAVALDVFNGANGPYDPVNGINLGDFFKAAAQGPGAGSISRWAMIGVEPWQNDFGQRWYEVWGQGVVRWDPRVVNHRPGRWNNWVNIPVNTDSTDVGNRSRQAGTIAGAVASGAVPAVTVSGPTVLHPYTVTTTATLDGQTAVLTSRGLGIQASASLKAASAEKANVVQLEALKDILKFDRDGQGSGNLLQEIDKAVRAQLAARKIPLKSGRPTATGQRQRPIAPLKQDDWTVIAGIAAVATLNGPNLKWLRERLEALQNKVLEGAGISPELREMLIRAYAGTNHLGVYALATVVACIVAAELAGQDIGPPRLQALVAEAARHWVRANAPLNPFGLRRAATNQPSRWLTPGLNPGQMNETALPGLLKVLANLAETDLRSAVVRYLRQPQGTAASINQALQDSAKALIDPSLSVTSRAPGKRAPVARRT